jgi:chemotaxis protein MotB
MAVDKDKRPIIVKKIIKAGGGHHGGAWKVAYADFVTAMMAFFLLLWLLGATTDDQRKGIADYFDPISVSSSTSGSGEIMGGKSPTEPGSQISNEQPTAIATPDQPGKQGNEVTSPVGKEEDQESVSDTVPKDPTVGQAGLTGQNTGKTDAAQTPADKKAEAEAAAKEQQKFEDTKKQLIQMIQKDPSLAGLAKNLIVDETPEGLRIQIIDTDGTPMFESGGTRISESMKKILSLVTQAIKGLPNKLSIRGHTDATPYRGWERDNWDLSADRANASRREIINSGIPADRIANVVGRADKDPLLPKDPKNAQNRRISVILMRDFPSGAATDNNSAPTASDTAPPDAASAPAAH